jgi:hypothetical protein
MARGTCVALPWQYDEGPRFLKKNDSLFACTSCLYIQTLGDSVVCNRNSTHHNHKATLDNWNRSKVANRGAQFAHWIGVDVTYP